MHTAIHLTQTLLHLDILPAEQAEGLAKVGAQQFPDAKTLAADLIRRGWLTPFQANQLLHGRGEELLLGAYVLLERIGEGAMGQVFKARQAALGRVVAIKMLRKERVANPDAVRRFQREVRAAAAFSHPNFVVLYDADAHNGIPFFVMEFVTGSDLSRLVKARGPLPIATACDYVRQAAEGLAFAHARGLVHRDIKPSNLFLCDTQVVKILDLGLARLDEAVEEPALTQDGKILGTPDYIAPEQAVNSRTADARADLYSLGCTLFALLTARVPFPGGGSIMERLMQHQTLEPTPIEQLRPEVPEAVRDVLRRLIRRRPEDRMQSAAELVTALQALDLRATTATYAARETMVERWYYRHGGETVGPLSAGEIKAHARAGRLAADDGIWPEGVPGTHWVRAELVIGAAAFAASGPTPGWLKDVAALERARAKPPAPSAAPRPRWLDEPAAVEPAPPTLAPAELPDWIDDIRRREGG
jgi:tRNA A-37 threonylcarbamoyl transferase component Bud32